MTYVNITKDGEKPGHRLEPRDSGRVVPILELGQSDEEADCNHSLLAPDGVKLGVRGRLRRHVCDMALRRDREESTGWMDREHGDS